MFLSQIAGKPQGLKLVYHGRSAAERVADHIRGQLERGGLRQSASVEEQVSAQRGDALGKGGHFRHRCSSGGCGCDCLELRSTSAGWKPGHDAD